MDERPRSVLTEEDWAIFRASHRAPPPPYDAPPPNEEGDYIGFGARPMHKPLPKLIPLRFVEGEILQPRRWIVPNGWIPARKVTLLQGDGGDGKSTLMQQLQSSCATALAWIGLPVEQCASVGFYTEEEDRDLKERQALIDAACGQHCASTGNLHLFPRADEDNELVVFDRAAKPTITPFYHQIREAALDLHARLVVLDVAVDLFGGDEINRRNVRAFIRPLGKLAREIDGSVTLTGHMSQAGIRSGGGHSASTDWSNAGRSRLYLNRPKGEDDEEADPDARLFTRKKANYASIGDVIKLRYQNGLFVPAGISTPSYFRRSAEDVFLALLDEHCAADRQPLSENSHAGNFAPRIFAGAAARDGYGEGDFRRAMERLFTSRKIKSAPYGRKGDERRKIERCDEA